LLHDEKKKFAFLSTTKKKKGELDQKRDGRVDLREERESRAGPTSRGMGGKKRKMRGRVGKGYHDSSAVIMGEEGRDRRPVADGRKGKKGGDSPRPT